MFSLVYCPGVDLERYMSGYIFIYSGSAPLISFEINLISKEISEAESRSTPGTVQHLFIFILCYKL